jgi:hypothetical protein
VPETPAQDAGWIWFSASHDLTAGVAPAVASLSKAMTAFRAAEMSAGLGLAAARAAMLLIMGGEQSDAASYLGEAVAVLGNYEAAIERSRNLAQEARSRRDWRRLGFVLANSANHFLLADDSQGARAAWREAIPLLIELAEPHWATDYGGNLALMAAKAGDFKTASRLAGFSAAYYESSAKPR